jgi:hypothetical protein
MPDAALSPGSDADLELTIVMPCLNEARTLESCVRKAMDAMARHQIRGEVVVGDNGSTDGSQAIARKLGARVVEVPARGYGAALMGGIAAARGRYVLMGDADGSYDFTDLMPFVDKLREGYDLVMGNRFLGGIQPGAMPALNHYLGNPVLTTIGRLFFHTPAHDINCGLRGFSKAAAQRMNLQTTGMEFASEMVVKASLLQMKTCEVPTTLSPDGRGRPPHLRRWRDGWRNLRFMLLYSPRWLFLYPGLGLLMAGVLLCAWLLPGPRKLGAVTLDLRTMLYAAMMALMGFQAVLFAVSSKVFAISEGLLPPDPRLERVFKVITLGDRAGRGAASIHSRDGGYRPCGLGLGTAVLWPAESLGKLASHHPFADQPGAGGANYSLQLLPERAGHETQVVRCGGPPFFLRRNYPRVAAQVKGAAVRRCIATCTVANNSCGE